MRESLRELLGVGRVTDLAIHRYYAWIRGPQRLQSIAIALTSRDSITNFVGWQCEWCRLYCGQGLAAVWLLHGKYHAAHRLQFLQRLLFLFFIQRLPVPAIDIFEEGNALSFNGFGNDQG